MKQEAKTLVIKKAAGAATAANIVLDNIDVEGFNSIHIAAQYAASATASTGNTMSVTVEAKDETNGTTTAILDGTEFEAELPTGASATQTLDVDVSANATRGAKYLKITLNGSASSAGYSLAVLGLAPRVAPISDRQV